LGDLVYNPLSEAYPVIICIDTNPINPELIIDLNHFNNEPPSPSPNTIPLVATTPLSPTQDNKQPDTTNNNSATTALSNSTPGAALQPVKKK